jgi:hypothetical protein
MPLLTDSRLQHVIETHGYASAQELMTDMLCRPNRRSGGGRDWIRHWELVALVRMRFNRLVVHAGNMLHGPILGRADFGRTLDTTRLTQNLFLEVVHLPPRIGKKLPHTKRSKPTGTLAWADLEDVSV